MCLIYNLIDHLELYLKNVMTCSWSLPNILRWKVFLYIPPRNPDKILYFIQMRVNFGNCSIMSK